MTARTYHEFRVCTVTGLALRYFSKVYLLAKRVRIKTHQYVDIREAAFPVRLSYSPMG